ncbi:MAG: hypothetical protein ACRDYE_12245 [Acidimicrobiales bacterium]
MSTFVDACRKEWDRLGVPEGVANEMAADLEADLTEADTDGVSPEEVLGNGYFDPESFAALWATERGVVSDDLRGREVNRVRSWRLASASLASAAAVMLGLAILVGVRHSSVSVAGVAFRRPLMPPVPSIFVAPHGILPVRQSGAFVAIGLVLLLVGLVGLAITLWFWRRSASRRRSGFDREIGMPSYI